MRFLRILLLYTGIVVTAITFKHNLVDTQSVTIVQSEPTAVEKFMKDVAIRESDGKLTAVNAQGMMGLYQFSKTTLRVLGYTGDHKVFLHNKELQDTMMVRNMKANTIVLQKYIRKYNNKTFKGVRITTAGILAAAHLGGAGSVIGWFNSNDPEGLVDANGTSIRNYMQRFSKHNLGELWL